MQVIEAQSSHIKQMSAPLGSCECPGGVPVAQVSGTCGRSVLDSDPDSGRSSHPVDLARPNGWSRLDVPDRQVLGLRSWFVLTEPRVRVLRCAVLEGQDAWVLDDAPADLDGPPDGLIEVPCAGACEHGPQVWQEGFADLPGGGVPQQRGAVFHGVVVNVAG